MRTIHKRFISNFGLNVVLLPSIFVCSTRNFTVLEEPRFDFSDIRPYSDNELPEVVDRLLKNPSYFTLMRYLYPYKTKEEIDAETLACQSIAEFQRKIAYPSMKKVLNQTASEITFSGLENIYPNKNYLFISNHRDIILDSAILNVLLIENDFPTLETAIGNNLLREPIIEDLTRLNKNFVVVRNSSKKEFYENSLKLSGYIHYAVREKGVSVWIAQKEGRTKDGMDKTQPGLLKMLVMKCGKEFSTCLKNLHIVPVAISYEYDPCDVLKIPELLAIQREEKYEKQPNEDFRSIITGLVGNKGRVHLSIGKPLDESVEALEQFSSLNDKVKELGLLIDKRIYGQYKLWPSNYIAADLLDESEDKFSAYYTSEEKETFIRRLEKQLKQLPGYDGAQKELLLKMYANPVMNCHATADSIQ